MDVVYILGTGSKWSNNEIRYSLRSLRNLPHGKVWVIGEHLPWFRNIHHVPAEDPYPNKQRNALHKLSVAVAQRGLSDDFILMNDDFFIMRPVTEIPRLYRRTLEEALEEHPAKGSAYYTAIQNTHALYPKGLDYSLHVPFVFNKQKLKKTINSIKDTEAPLLLRTVYGNMHKVGGSRFADVKATVKDFKRQRQIPTGTFFSTDDIMVRTARFRKLIKRAFPAPSPYEAELA